MNTWTATITVYTVCLFGNNFNTKSHKKGPLLPWYYLETHHTEARVDSNITQSDIALLYIEDGFDLTSPNIKKISVADSQPAAGSAVTIAGMCRSAGTSLVAYLSLLLRIIMNR